MGFMYVEGLKPLSLALWGIYCLGGLHRRQPCHEAPWIRTASLLRGGFRQGPLLELTYLLVQGQAWMQIPQMTWDHPLSAESFLAYLLQAKISTSSSR